MASIGGVSGIVLEPLTEDNYDNWSSLVRNYLKGHDLWDGVLGPRSIDQTDTDKDLEIKNAKALHVIQLACGSENLTRIRDFHSAKEAWIYFSTTHQELNHLDIEQQGVLDANLLYYRSLHSSIVSAKWDDLQMFLNEDDTAINFRTDFWGRTILHIAAVTGNVEIVNNLVQKGKDMLVKMKDRRGYTALALVAELTGNTYIALSLLKNGSHMDQDLLSMKTNDGETPILLAAAKGHKSMTMFLYRHQFTLEDMTDAVLLFTRCINAEIFDVALSLLQRFPQMPLAHKSESNYESDGIQPLYALASMPYVFPSASRYGFIRRLLYKFVRIQKRFVRNFYEANASDGSIKEEYKIYVGWTEVIKMKFEHFVISKFPGMLKIYFEKKTHFLVLEIMNCLYKKIEHFKESELREAAAYDAILQAAKHGIIEFVDGMRKANPELLWAIDKNKRGIFAHAILNRRKAVFQLIYDLTFNGPKDIIKYSVDVFDNSLLHLAGNLGPSSNNYRSGPALQMQRELSWFKAVQAIVHPKYKEAKNKENKKPSEIFTESHEELVKAGEKWTKDTAGSFTLVATLITTIMFAAAFTVPGGNNQDSGIPIFLKDKIFNVFIIADAISLFTSSTAVLLFIGILTARYAENDFLKSLPIKLLFGLIMLFFSVVSMMVAFCASLAMLLKGHEGIIITAMSFACIPVIVFLPSQLRLFVEIFKSTVLSN